MSRLAHGGVAEAFGEPGGEADLARLVQPVNGRLRVGRQAPLADSAAAAVAVGHGDTPAGRANPGSHGDPR